MGSRLLGVAYAAGRKKAKKHTEHDRVQLWGAAEHKRRPYTHATRQKTHTGHERVQFWVPLNTRGCITHTPHGAPKGTKARTRTEKTLGGPFFIRIHIPRTYDPGFKFFVRQMLKTGGKKSYEFVISCKMS